MVDVVALSPPRRRIQAYRAKHTCFNVSETYDRLGLKHLQVPCIPTNTGGWWMIDDGMVLARRSRSQGGAANFPPKMSLNNAAMRVRSAECEHRR